MKIYKLSVVLGVVLMLLLTTTSSFALPLNQTEFKEISGAPLRIEVGSNGSIQVYHQNHPERGAAYGTADSGFFLAIGSDVYSPDLQNTNESSAYPSGPANPLSLVSHEGPTGSGSDSDPFKIVTTQTLDGSGASLGVVQTVSYINGKDYFRQDWDITNNGSSEVCFKAYHAADVYFAGSDSGAGYYSANSGSVGGYNADQDWFMVFTPITPADHYQEGHYNNDIWSAVSTAGDLTDTIVTESVDNGFALQWNKCVQPGETTTISDYWSFGIDEVAVIPPTPVPATPTPVPPTPMPTPTSTSVPDIVPGDHGDVHIRTPDGLVYDFQEVGDFILTQSTSGPVMLQARQESWVNNPQVSVNTAVAMNVAGDILEFYLNSEIPFYINDAETALPSSVLQLSQGGSINLSGTGDPRDFTILWPDGNTGARVILRDTYMDIGIARLNGSLTYEGVLGNLDGNAQNDMQSRNGDLITPPANLDQLKSFGDSWRVSAEDSLFNDAFPIDEEAVPEAPLTLLDLDPEVRADARQTCQEANISDQLALDNCTYDVAATGDDSFVESAKSLDESLAELPPEAKDHVAAVPSQSLEIGAQYAVPDAAAPGTFQYFQLTQLPEQAGEPATLQLCPDLQGAGLVFVDDIMSDEAAMAQGLTAANEPCVQTEVEVVEEAGDPAEPVEESEDTAETAEEPEAPVEPTEAPDEGGSESPVSGLCNAPMVMPLFVGLGFLAVNRRRKR